MAYNPPIGSIYHLYTTYILPPGGLYATYHLIGEPETTIDLYILMTKHLTELRPGKSTVKVDGNFQSAIWVFPKIGVPPNHPF